MPELPEVETLRRSLEDALIGAQVVRATVRRRDVVRVHPSQSRTRRSALLEGDQIVALERRGKQMAILGRSNRVLCIHLGMSGQVLREPVTADSKATGVAAAHRHVIWHLERTGSSGTPGFTLVFRDPRRFGGIWTFPDRSTLTDERWSALGPDALKISSRGLSGALSGTQRAIKAALLDQSLIAGLGNIYVDEALFRARIHPESPANRITPAQNRALAQAIRTVLHKSLHHGGTTLRDYRDADGTEGRNASRLSVYGRGGQSCVRCKTDLINIMVSQRTTTFCPICQSVDT